MTREVHVDQYSEILFAERNRVSYETGEKTFRLGPNDVLVHTRFSTISAGTELAKLTGLQEVDYPYAPGNRAVGEVAAVGEEVKEFAPGDLIFTHTPHASHALATRFRAPVPADVPPAHAPLVGMALVAITALRVSSAELGDQAVVLGMGVVGALCAQLLENAGVSVIGVDISASRLERARRCGVSSVVHAGEEDVRERVMDETAGRGVELVVEATGRPEGAEIACSLTAKQGEVVLLGSPRGEYRTDLTPLLNAVHLWRDHGSIALKGAHEWRYPLYPDGYAKHSMLRNAEIIFRLMAAGRLNTAELVTHVLPPRQAADAFEGLLRRKDEYLAVVFDWTQD